MTTHIGIALDHPANAVVVAAMREPPAVPDRATLLARLRKLIADHPTASLQNAIVRLERGEPDPPPPERFPSAAPDSIDKYQLGTHPDIIDRLWQIGRALPRDCSWMCYRQPVLAHAATGIVFGLGIGTLGFALRLPPDAAPQGLKQETPCAGLDGPYTFSLLCYGPDWWFGSWNWESDMALARAAYDYFGACEGPASPRRVAGTA